MRVLVVGKAKTGTTALVSLVKQALEPCQLVMEPQSVLDFGAASRAHQGNEAIKILFEHYRGRPRHLDAIVHAEFGFPVDRVVFIVRDVRDEILSKLLYHAKIVRNDDLIADGAPEKLASWVDLIAQKEQDPASLSFQDLCHRFDELTNENLWARLTDMATLARLERYIRDDVERDCFVLRYEAMVAGDISALAEHLGVALPASLDAVDLGSFGHTRRSGEAGNWRSFFTPDDVQVLRPLVAEWFTGPQYDDWDLTPVDHLDPEQYSRYVARIALG
jgi:hypothetical protein